MERAAILKRILEHPHAWDMVIIGGGATGVGVAVDAASRGFDVLLLEQHDFGKGTSSRSTKLVHGGVRYLEQGNVSLVMEALKERGLLRNNAPHLVHDLPFVVPNYDWWEAPFYGLGLKVYDMLAGKYGFGQSRLLSKAEILEIIPTVKTEGLRGGVLYYDGQFDDSRLLINLVSTAAEQGAALLNYAPVKTITKDSEGYVDGVVATDSESGTELRVKAKVVINATGAFTDNVRRLADQSVLPMIAPSQGIHLVFDRSIMPGDTAIMVPHTSDGRVMFAIPWHQHVLVGTTDTPIDQPTLEPVPFEQEIEFILETACRYLERAPSRQDVLSVFVGIRPLVKMQGASSTAALSRDHTIHFDASGLLTICGGKWTTYRHMAEDCVDHAITLARLEDRSCVTKTLRIHGYQAESGLSPAATIGPAASGLSPAATIGPAASGLSPAATITQGLGELSIYGSDALKIKELIAANPKLGEPLHPQFPYCGAQVVWAVRAEMARTVEDFLSRRVRALFLNSKAAAAMAPAVAAIMATELGRDADWVKQQVSDFQKLANQYSLADAVPGAVR